MAHDGRMTMIRTTGAIIIALAVASSAVAAPYETIGMVQSVDLGGSIIRVNAKLYRLPNRVTESLHPGGGPVIHQLQPGTTVSFSGDAADSPPLIESMAILRQPTAEDLETLQRAMTDEDQ